MNSDDIYRSTAQRDWEGEEDVCIDDLARVIRHKDGAWVSAWVWVEVPEDEPELPLWEKLKSFFRLAA